MCSGRFDYVSIPLCFHTLRCIHTFIEHTFMSECLYGTMPLILLGLGLLLPLQLLMCLYLYVFIPSCFHALCLNACMSPCMYLHSLYVSMPLYGSIPLYMSQVNQKEELTEVMDRDPRQMEMVSVDPNFNS